MPLFGKKKEKSEKPAGGPAYPTAPAYPQQPAYSQQTAPPPQGAYGVPPQQGPPPAQATGAPPPYTPYPQAGGPAQPPPQMYYQPPQPTTVVASGAFDAGARFDGIAQANIPPPPPGVMPNAAQVASMQGHNVVATQQRGDFISGGSDGGYTVW